MSSTTEISTSLSINLTFTKANKIHLELLSFIKNELNQKKNIAGKKFSFPVHIEIIKEENHKNNEQKSTDTYFNSDDVDNIDEDESSSEMSCNEESIIDL